MSSCNLATRNKCSSKGSKTKSLLKTLSAIIQEYISYQKVQNPYKVIWSSIGDCVFGRHNNSYTDLVSVTPSSRDHHQCCLNTNALLSFVHLLEKNESSFTNNNFDMLWQQIRKLVVTGIGPVTCYDTALRYSLYKGLPEPQYVYLHSAKGPLKGAKAYFKFKKMKKVTTPDGMIDVDSLKAGCRVDISYFPDFVASNLDSKNIENLLCIYADDLNSLNTGNSLCALHNP